MKQAILKQARQLLKKEADERELRLVVNLLKERDKASKIFKKIEAQLRQYEKGQLDVEELYDDTFYI
ncbi:MAG: hypothetical protein WC307_07105 [Candidatus Nanoarchaeia archaeon]